MVKGSFLLSRKIAFLLCFLSLSLNAEVYSPTFLNLEAGYRWDKIISRVSLINPVTLTGSTASTTAGRKLSSYQLGGSAQATIYQRLIVKGCGHFGWITNGTFDSNYIEGGAKGNTIDGSGAVGYLFNVHPCFGITPLIGFAYDRLEVKGENTSTLFAEVSTGDVDYFSTFTSGFGGVDLYFQPHPVVDFLAGWELHYGNWKGHYEPKSGEIGMVAGLVNGFASTQRVNSMFGNAFSFDASYLPLRTLRVGLKLKYQIWQSSGRGSYTRTATPLPFNFEKTAVTDVEWESFSALIHVGYNF